MWDDDRQSRAFIFSKWKSGCMMEMMGMEGVRAKGERAEEVAERNADSGNAVENYHGNSWP